MKKIIFFILVLLFYLNSVALALQQWHVDDGDFTRGLSSFPLFNIIFAVGLVAGIVWAWACFPGWALWLTVAGFPLLASINLAMSHDDILVLVFLTASIVWAIIAYKKFVKEPSKMEGDYTQKSPPKLTKEEIEKKILGGED